MRVRLFEIPGAKALVLLCWAMPLAVPADVHANEGRCLVVVDGHTFLKGRCNIEIGTGGSFTVGVGDKSRSEHFAYVTLDGGTDAAVGYWNGVAAESHADEHLGPLKRKGACWSNSRARICAWR
ncbi:MULTISPECIES: hypothetical protein [Bradyrhizobium]|uniref:hypothetical protein n=1 Tax=Bradyrhizobium TaxID=374 RepID=UPI00155F2524|nr:MULTISPECIES: hypothetical protein [Bradyrhizobium]MDD1568451.1 hypothetical protein [Bradyrhizobium sp. WBAH33]UUO27252.1 hypothetical protein DCG74_08170 [Bradyrhizobium sp. WBAH42]